MASSGGIPGLFFRKLKVKRFKRQKKTIESRYLLPVLQEREKAHRNWGDDGRFSREESSQRAPPFFCGWWEYKLD